MPNPLKKLTAALKSAYFSAGKFLPAQTIAITSITKPILILGLSAAVAYGLITNNPITQIPRGMIGVRTGLFNSDGDIISSNNAIVVPGIQQLRLFDMRDQTYMPEDMRSANGLASIQSLEGLSLGMDLHVRYALNKDSLLTIANKLSDNIGRDVVEPAVQGLVYKIVAQYTVREIFSTKRQIIQEAIETALKPKLADDGIVLKSLQIGKIDLPEDYKRGMEAMLAEELASEKMRYTLAIKDKHIKESELEAEAEKVRREKVAQAAALEQVIAAKAQEDAMRHILPFKERQIKQRELEAEADKQSRIRSAEAGAKSREIEAVGEATARQKLADAEVYRMERVGKANAEQMEREGVLVTKHPLLIQKAMADKLSDKIQVIIAPPNTGNGFIAAGLIGQGGQNNNVVSANQESSGQNTTVNSEVE